MEPLIHSCEGLLLLDKKLNIVRFSHLSVQEYLETRDEIWNVNVIDAQLYVSESCLWALQSSPEASLYEYAACNWFKHCRSYQDRLRSSKDIKYEMNIPLLSSFLGCFTEPSSSYVNWASWVEKKGKYHDLAVVLSTPLCPAFSAAYTGMGELVSWLWDSDGNDLEIANNSGLPLLGVASMHGTKWSVAEMLKAGKFQISSVQGALYSALEGGNISTIEPLLDSGANVNFTGGIHGTALGTAAHLGKLDIAKLLIDRGADVNLTGGLHGSALGNAAYQGHVDIVTLLLDQGANVNLAGDMVVP